MISPQATNIYFISWWPIESIYVHSENIDIRNDGTDLVYIEYYAGYKSDLYWWRKMVWNFCNHSTDVQSTASTEILQTFPMTNLINICSFWEYRHSPWRYCSRGHRILCWIEIGLKLVEKGGLEFPLQQHWSCSSPQQAPKIYTPSWLMTNSIYICSFWEYRYSKWLQWSRVHRILCLIEIGLQLVEKDGWFGILVMQQSTRTEIVHILMTNLINICRHWSRVHRILF